MGAMPTERFVALNDGAIGQRHLLCVAIILLVNESIHFGECSIGLTALAPLDLDGPALAPGKSSSAWVMSGGEGDPEYLAWPWVM